MKAILMFAAVAVVAALAAPVSAAQSGAVERCAGSMQAQWEARSSRFLRPETVYEINLEAFGPSSSALARIPGRLGLRVENDMVLQVGPWPNLLADVDRSDWDAHGGDRFQLVCRAAVRARVGYVDVIVSRPGATQPIFYVRWTSEHMLDGYRRWRETESGESPLE
ncbi:MAG TPA: hypothetical protein VD887_12555 [Allosphingosinicella sp.]|nr:hypothetical protein [Allosphingosinicella sp.]